MSSKPRQAISRHKPARDPLDTTKDDAEALKSHGTPIAKRKRGRDAPQASDYSVLTTVPENLPITEAELRALEILLGTDLKKLLAETAIESLKFTRLNR